ncbi:hypothetical protein [Absidia glauca]|uniref:Ndc10 domain-containing protein n=1 Tax=Absidia glauca TaxID=4829 RepID=A0A163K3H5_ABSGL|nr:hypothetical protein [Absidia glauca]
MATDIGSLTAGLDGHVIRLGLVRTHFPIVEYVAVALLNITTRLPSTLCTPPSTRFTPQVSSPLLHSLNHDTRLVIPSPVQYIP